MINTRFFSFALCLYYVSWLLDRATCFLAYEKNPRLFMIAEINRFLIEGLRGNWIPFISFQIFWFVICTLLAFFGRKVWLMRNDEECPYFRFVCRFASITCLLVVLGLSFANLVGVYLNLVFFLYA